MIVGADVEALYPSLSDVDVALICFQAVMDTKIKFDNVNYRAATQYIALNLSETERRLSPLAKILPRRTTNVGAKPGVLHLHVKVATLTEEVVRRLKHTSLELPQSSRLETL